MDPARSAWSLEKAARCTTHQITIRPLFRSSEARELSRSNLFKFEDAPEAGPNVYVASLPMGIARSSALLEALYVELQLPGYFGFNWDALSDCLRDLHWMKQRTVVLRHGDLPHLPEAELRIYLDVLSEAVASWGAEEEHSLAVSFPRDVRRNLERVLCEQTLK